MRNRNTGFFELDQEGHEQGFDCLYMICNTGMYCANSHQGGSVHLWSATHSANSGALSGLAVVLAARLAAVLAARLTAVLTARLVAGLASHILLYTAVPLAANKKIPKYTAEFYKWLFNKLSV
jgi:hypothetical protein